MHSFIKKPKNLTIIIAIWIPVILSIITVAQLQSGTGIQVSFVLLFPPLFLLIFILLSNGYICKSSALAYDRLFSIIPRHLLASVLMVGVWLQLAMLYSETLGIIYKDDVYRSFFYQTVPLLAVFGFVFYFIIALIHYFIINEESKQKAIKLALENKLNAAQTQLNSLKATIHPHFLFNSLNALGTLAETDSALAKAITFKLADFIRYSLKYGGSSTVSVKEEMEHIHNYLAVEKMRLGNRLTLSIAVDESANSLKIFPLLILPLAENAVKHGVEGLIEGGVVSISIKNYNDYIDISVKNPFSDSVVKKPGNNLGLSTLRKRLNGLYKNKASLQIDKSSQEFKASIFIDK
jgi:sensor histidine kinase YesM